MYSQNLTVLDLRNTLPNLKTLVLSLSYGEWSREYREASLYPLFADPDQVGDTREAVPDPEEEEEGTEEGLIDSNEQGGSESHSSSGSTESNSSDPSTTPETSIDSLPVRDDVDTSASSTRSRSSSLASSSTIKVSDQPINITNRTKRSSSRDSKSSSATSSTLKPLKNGGVEKPLSSSTPSSSPSSTSSSSANKPISSLNGSERVKVKVEKGKTASRGRTISAGSSGYGSRFANSVWSAVAGKAGERERGTSVSGGERDGE